MNKLNKQLINILQWGALSLSLMAIPLCVMAKPTKAVNDVPLLVIDEAPGKTLPQNYRDTFHLNDKDIKNTKGLEKLNAVASAQFSIASLENVLKTIPKPAWIIDLRQETHGFINSLPISWFSSQNQSNLGKSNDNLIRQENMLFHDIARQPGVVVHKILEKKEGEIVDKKELTLNVKTAETESELVNRLGINYLRLGVRDHHAPNDVEIDEFVDFVQKLPANDTIYIHCRRGKGRSTTFMVLYDILKNGKEVSLEEIVERQAALGGTHLFKVSEEDKDQWKRDAALERKAFIRKFYQYATDKKRYPTQCWSDWKRQN